MKIASVCLLIAAATAAAILYSPRVVSEDAAAPMAEVRPEVGVIKVEEEKVSITQELNGRVSAFLMAEVRPQVNGIILSRLFAEGSDVEKNMPLYQIDPAMYEADLMRAKAGLEKARASVAVQDAKLARYRRLIEARAVNQQEYDEVEADCKQAEAEVAIAEAEVRIAEINLNYAKVRAPISGRIGKSTVTQGALVTASQSNPLAVVQQLDPIYVDVSQPVSWLLNVREEYSAAAVLGNTGETHAQMRVRLENGQMYEHAGKILFADVTVDQSTGTISVRAEFPNPDHVLLPGMFVTAFMVVAEKDNAITVPQRSLFRERDGGAYVLVVGEDGTVERRAVETIRTIDDRWLLSSGLKAGERVAVDGLQRVRLIPGMPAPKVQPIDVASEAAADNGVASR